ncbi:hypothetical protein N7530_009722 [Penicillium desertorum]|uniref:Uncharacterized protein n=1 Tax=Penicillium desertorum TaxID=1303715 RepID=A0A9W9WJ52_9EURO|nr:hypothetical protein N7530_009722 [Penicillium desertorum]
MASNLNREKCESRFSMVLWSDKKSVANESTFEQPNEKLGYRLGILIILSESNDSLAAVKMESPVGLGVIGSKDTKKLPTCPLKSRDGIKGDIEAIRSIMTSLSDLPTHLGYHNPSVEKANTSNSVEDQVKVSFIIKLKT